MTGEIIVKAPAARPAPAPAPWSRARRTTLAQLSTTLCLTALALGLAFPAAPCSAAPAAAPDSVRVSGEHTRDVTNTAQREAEAHTPLLRPRDVVILESPETARIFHGRRPDEIRLYRYGPDGFRPIPFQIDFIGDDGMVIPEHRNRGREKDVYDFAPNPDHPTTISGRTQVLFMAEHAGERYTGEGAPEGFRKGMEIVVDDPTDGRRGWAYLLEPRAAYREPAGTDNYVAYLLVPGPDGRKTQEIRTRGVTMGFRDLEKPYVFTEWRVPVEAGGDDTDFLATVRVRLKIRFLFFTFDLDPSSHVFPYVMGYRDGPIRVTRRVRSSVIFSGIRMDRLLDEASLETESHYLRDYSFFDGSVSFPGLIKRISRIHAVITTEFNPNATGLVWTNSNNDAGMGCLVDGRMSPQERALDTGPYLWARLQGPQGGWAHVLRVHNPSVRAHMNLAYLDDAAFRDEKEPGLLGAWGSTGFSLDRIDRAEEKITWRSFVFSIPRHFTDRDMEGLLRLVQHPLETRLGNVWLHQDPNTP